MRKVTTLDPNDANDHPASPRPLGAPITQLLDDEANVGPLTIRTQLYGSFEPRTQHNFARAFEDFIKAPLLESLVGLPLSEPYWTVQKVGGVAKLILVQVFERRVLTFTPDNLPERRIEFSDVGRHYAHWRYPSAAAT